MTTLPGKRWHLTAKRTLRLQDRLRVLFGVPLYVRFTSPDGQCHAACDLAVVVQRAWPADDECLGGVPLPNPLPPPAPPNTKTRTGYG